MSAINRHYRVNGFVERIARSRWPLAAKARAPSLPTATADHSTH